MGGWGQPARCDAVDPSGNRCVLQPGHPGPHAASAMAPGPTAFVVGLLVLVVAGMIDLFMLVAAYYGLGGATATPGGAYGLMWLGLVALPVGVVLSMIQRRRAAAACAAVVLLQVPVGLIALASRPSGDGWADGMFVLAFTIPGLLLLGYVWVTPRLFGRRSTG